jgi:hypothetical protein
MATPFNQGVNATATFLNSSNVYMIGNVFGPSGEQLTQGAALTQKIQDLAGGFSNGVPGVTSSTSIVGASVVQSTLSPFGQGLEGSVYVPNSASSYVSAVNQTFNQNWRTNQMTAEGWFYFPSFSQGTSTFFGHYQPAGSGFDWTFNVSTGGVFTFYYWNGSVGNTATGPTLSINTWYHLCVQSDGTNIFIFSNGTLSSTTGISGTPVITSTYPLVFGAFNSLAPPAFYVSSPRLTFAANLYSQGSFTAPTTPLGIAPTGQTVMLLRNPLYSAMTLKNPLNVQSSVRVRCLPSDALIYVDAFGSNMPNKAPVSNAPTFDPYGTGAVLFRSAQSQYLDFAPQFINFNKGFTVVAKVQMVLSPTNLEYIFQIYASSGNLALIRSYAAAPPYPSTFYTAMTSGSSTNAGSPTLYQDVPYVVTVRYDGSTGILSIWSNGVSIGTGSLANAPNFNAGLFQIGANTGGGIYSNMNLYTFAAYNRALTDNEITDASAMLNQVAPVVPRTVEIGNVNGRPALTVDPTGAVNVLGPLNGAPGGYAPVDLGVNSLSLATGNLTSNISVTSFSPLGSSEGSLYFPGVLNTYISFGTNGQPFANSNIYSFGDFVMEGWINVPSYTSSNAIVYGYGSPESNFLYWAMYLSTTGQLGWYSFLNNTTYGYLATTATLPLGTWNHVGLIHQSSSRRLQLYINGQPQALTVATGGFTSSGTVGSYTTGTVPVTGYQTVIGQVLCTTVAIQGTFNGYFTNGRITTGSGAAQIYNNNAFVPSTSPLFPASNTAGGSLTTRLLVRVPRGPGQVQTQKLIGAPATGFSGVQAFPPAPMTTYVTNLTGLAPYGQGTYVASASNEFDSGSNALWRAFDKSASTIWTGDGSSYTSGNYVKSPPVTTVDVNGTSYTGEWIQLQMPSSIILSNYQICSPGSQGPSLFYLLGSRDGTNWFLVDSRSGQVPNSTYLTYPVSSSQAFTYFRLVTNKISGGNSYVQILELIFNGTIEGPNVTPDGRLGLGVSNPVQALEVAGSAVVAGTLSAGNPITFKNRFINGDMRIAQRGTSNVIVNATSCYYVDRFSNYLGITGGGATAYQNTLTVNDSGPYQQGFRYAANVVITSTLSANPVLCFQILEGWMAQDFNWGTPYGSPITISYWFKSSATGTFSYGIRNAGPFTIAYTGFFTYANAGVWQYISYTVSPPPTGYAWQTGNLAAIEVHVGGTFQGTVSPVGWNAGSNFGISGGANWYSTNGYVAFTGVQLEKGTVATPFEVRPYATELQLCQRYYEKSYDQGVNPGTATAAGVFTGVAGNPSGLQGPIFKVPKRAAPIGSGIAYYSKTGTVSVLTNWSNDLDGSAVTGGGDYSQYGIRYILASVTTGSLYYYHWTVSTEL